jgi:hypothetical protein
MASGNNRIADILEPREGVHSYRFLNTQTSSLPSQAAVLKKRSSEMELFLILAILFFLGIFAQIFRHKNDRGSILVSIRVNMANWFSPAATRIF